MDRYQSQWPKDDASHSDGDAAFVGVNSKLSPEKLPTGFARAAINLCMRDGQAATRRGLCTVLHFNPRMTPGASGYAIWGSGRYADVDGREWMLIATDLAAYRLADGVAPQRFDFPEAVTAECAFVQFANQVYLFRGEDAVPWRWDGTPTGTWSAISQIDPGNASKPLPGAATAETIGDRLIVPRGRDTVLFTDLSDAGHYDEALNASINTGTNDNLVRLFPYANGAVLAFKSRSVYLLEQVFGDLSQVTLTNISRAVGCVARRSVAWVGADVWFLSAAGVQRISQVLQNRLQTDPVPMSDPIQPFFTQRVHWAAAAGATATTHDEYFYLAVPIDGSPRNNAVLVCNTSTGNWEGYWTFPTDAPSVEVEIAEFVTTDYHGRQRLFAIDRRQGYVYLMHEGLIDRLGTRKREIPTTLVTRGYMIGTAELKQFTRAEVVLQTHHPKYSVSLSTGEALPTFALATDRTRDRTTYYNFALPPWHFQNLNDDHATPGRQDYTLKVPFYPWNNGVLIEHPQTALERFAVRARGRWASLTVTGTQGRCDVVSIAIEGRQAGRTTRTQP